MGHARLSLIFWLCISSLLITIHSDDQEEQKQAFIVYVAHPVTEPWVIQVLTDLLGSYEAARESLLYVYSSSADGFAAKLTEAQASELSNKPGFMVKADGISVPHETQNNTNGGT